MEHDKKEIRICSRHHNQIPLIWTFAFNGSEYWCPYCGANYGMLGAGEMVESTMDLKRAAVKWRQSTTEYLDAKSTNNCSELEWEGKMISPHDLPDEEKERVQKVINEWKYEADKSE